MIAKNAKHIESLARAAQALRGLIAQAPLRMRHRCEPHKRGALVVDVWSRGTMLYLQFDNGNVALVADHVISR